MQMSPTSFVRSVRFLSAFLVREPPGNNQSSRPAKTVRLNLPNGKAGSLKLSTNVTFDFRTIFLVAQLQAFLTFCQIIYLDKLLQAVFYKPWQGKNLSFAGQMVKADFR